MISRGEIKKCGWKPTGAKSDIWDVQYEGKFHGRFFNLELKDEQVTIYEIVPNESDNQVPFEVVKFAGNLPKRHELQIIMRCLGIG
jgi:hypothetical protein